MAAETPQQVIEGEKLQGQVVNALRNGTTQVVMAVLVGIVLGLSFSEFGWDEGDRGESVVRVLAFPGTLWLKALKCIVLPMIVFSMIQAMVMLRSLPGARAVGVGVVMLYSLTTLLAAVEGCLVSVLVMKPLLGDVTSLAGQQDQEKPELSAEMSALDSVLNIFDGLVPSNLVGDAAEGYLLPVIMASIVFGLLVKATNEDGTQSATLTVIDELNHVVVSVVTFLMKLTPLGVGCLVFASATDLDIASTGHAVGMFVLSVIIGLLIHGCVVYPSLILLFAGRNPFRYVCNILPALLTALGTSSSAATLPVTTRCSVERNGIAPHVAKFVLSLGATINMDGTGLYLICACFFLGRIEGVEFTFGKLATMALLAMLCSLGTAPVPSASLVLLATIMSTVGIEFTSSFALITAVDWLLEPVRTVVSVAGDATVTAIVDKWLGASKVDLDESESESGCSCTALEVGNV